MPVEYRILGPLEAAWTDSRRGSGGRSSARRSSLLLCQPNTVVPASRLVDGLWGDDPPASAANLVQGYVSGLRKALGKEAIETRGAGYVARRRAGRARPPAVRAARTRGSERARAGRSRRRRSVLCRGARRSGAGPRSPTSRTSRLSAARSRASRSSACSRSSGGSRPSSRSGATPTSSRSSRRSWRSIRSANGRGGC